MEEKCRAVVLRAVDYKDNDKILTLFSLENGVVSAAIRGVKRAGAKLKFAAQPFCFCEYVLRVKGDKRSVISADIIESFYPIRENITKFYTGAVALEFVGSFMQEGMDGRELFISLMGFLKTLCYTEVSPKIALSKFLLEGLALSGYELSVNACAKCRKTLKNRAFFDFNIGSAVCEDCRESLDVEVNPNTLAMLSDLSHYSYDELEAVGYPLMIQNKAIKLLCHYSNVKAGVVLRAANDLMLYCKND